MWNADRPIKATEHGRVNESKPVHCILGMHGTDRRHLFERHSGLNVVDKLSPRQILSISDGFEDCDLPGVGVEHI